MKKCNFLSVVIFAILFFNFALSYSQSSQSSISLSGGYTQEGYALMGSYNYYKNESDLIKIGVLGTSSITNTDNIEIPYNILMLNVGYYTKLFSTKNNNFRLSIGGGGLIGYESINSGENELENGSLLISESALIYGAFGGLDLDIFISDNLSFLGEINQYYHTSDLGNFTLFAGIGLRYFLN